MRLKSKRTQHQQQRFPRFRFVAKITSVLFLLAAMGAAITTTLWSLLSGEMMEAVVLLLGSDIDIIELQPTASRRIVQSALQSSSNSSATAATAAAAGNHHDLTITISAVPVSESQSNKPASNNTHIKQPQSVHQQQQCGREPCGKCAELIEAAKFTLQQQQQQGSSLHPSSSSSSSSSLPLHVKMVQLLGQWDDDYANQVMQRVFAHNQRMLLPHGITAVAVTTPTAATAHKFQQHFGSTNYTNETIKPAFWKIGNIIEQCSFNDGTDLLLYIDGDVVIMDPYARVEFLWMYHSHLAQTHDNTHLDMLFAHDYFGYNSGIIVVNCTSETALQTLHSWQDAAIQMLLHHKDIDLGWMDQKTLHYMLHTTQWLEIPKNQYLYWDEHLHEYGLSSDVYSSEQLRKRLRRTTQCALNTFPRYHRFQYAPGHFIVHTAGLTGQEKLKFLDSYQAEESWATQKLTLVQATEAYLRTHSFEYTQREVTVDWTDKPSPKTLLSQSNSSPKVLDAKQTTSLLLKEVKKYACQTQSMPDDPETLIREVEDVKKLESALKEPGRCSTTHCTMPCGDNANFLVPKPPEGTLISIHQAAAIWCALELESKRLGRPANLLVFGLGNDSLFWQQSTPGGRVIFLEDNKNWFNSITRKNAELEAYLVKYTTNIQRDIKRLNDPSLTQENDHLLDSLLSVMSETFDVFLVDAPNGCEYSNPGRFAPVFTSKRMVMEQGHGVVLVDDYNRDPEVIISMAAFQNSGWKYVAQWDRLHPASLKFVEKIAMFAFGDSVSDSFVESMRDMKGSNVVVPL